VFTTVDKPPATADALRVAVARRKRDRDAIDARARSEAASPIAIIYGACRQFVTPEPVCS
jgi:hypothetical protein